LKNHEDIIWKKLLNHVVDIFIGEYKKEQEAAGSGDG
jgi:hypothetical protein